MPVIAMKVVSAENHPDAKRLRVYQFEDAAGDKIQVVANLTNVYEVGDVAAVATIGTTVEGMLIKEVSLREIPSYGMAMGKVEAEIGSDLSSQFGAE